MSLAPEPHPYAELVPVCAIWHLREWDRRPGGRLAEATPREYWDRLRADICARGFESPLILEYDPRRGTGYLGEGNTRLAVASDYLQIGHVPVRVLRTTKDDAQ